MEEPTHLGLGYVEKKLWKVINLASIGFYQSLNNNSVYNTLFLRLMIEAYKALQEVKNLRRTGAIAND